MVGELDKNRQAELRMCFDYISQVREFENRTLKHNTTMLVIILGGLSWLLFSGTPLNIYIQVIIGLFLASAAVVMIYTSLVVGSTDRHCQNMQALILNGTITNRQDFVREYDRSFPKSRLKVNAWMNSATDLVDSHHSKQN